MTVGSRHSALIELITRSGVGIGVRCLEGRHDQPGPWGSETRIRSRGGAVILVDQPTEQIPSANVARTDQHRVRRFGSWRGEAEGAMGSPAVVVLDIGPERPIEMPPTSG
jgi:hypothetical protein